MKTLVLVFILIGLPFLFVNISKIKRRISIYSRYLAIKCVKMDRLYDCFIKNPCSVSDKDLLEMYSHFFKPRLSNPLFEFDFGRAEYSDGIGGYEASLILEEIRKRNTEKQSE